MTVCGPRRAKYGVNPFHNDNTPSCLDTLIRTSIDPLYSGTPPGWVFMFWILFETTIGLTKATANQDNVTLFWQCRPATKRL